MTRSRTDREAVTDADSQEWFRAATGPLRAYFRVRAEQAYYRRLQQWLDQAAIQTPADAYLARAAVRAAVGVLVGAALGLAATGGLTVLGVITRGAAVWVGVVAAVGGGLLGGGGVFAGAYGYPFLVAYRRGRRTEAMLPHASLFLYALVHGGANLYTVLDDLADAELVYGEVAEEFDRFVMEIQWLGVDLLTGIDRAADRAPSEELAGFFEELGNVLETGGDTQSFLRESVETQIDRAEDDLERFLDDVQVISEAYIVLVFAGPIFMFVTLTIVSFFNPIGLVLLKLLVYLYVPAGVVFYLWLFDHLIGPLQFSLGHIRFETDGGRAGFVSSSVVTAEESEPGRVVQMRKWLRRVTALSLRERLRRLHDRPGGMFVVTVPLAFLALGVVAFLDLFPVGVQPLFTEPVAATTGTFVVPFLVATTPTAAVYEWNERRIRRIRERFPTALRIIADANRNGVPLGECFRTVADRTSPPLGEELARVHHDIQWFNDIDRALKTFANRLAVPAVSRIVFLLSASLESTHDVAPIADIVARDMETRNELLARRKETMQSYVVIVFVGVLVFLVIVAMFELAFLPTLKRFTEAGGERLEQTPLRLAEISIITYRRLLFHAAVIQAVGNGLLLGKMADNDIYSGLKYANVLLVAVVGLFWVIV